jgi:hypothetical protein
LTTDEWKKEIAAAAQQRPAPIRAVTYVNKLNGSISRAFVVKGSDGKKYAVKGMQDRKGQIPFDIRRPLCNDQIVGRLGIKMGAPVPGIVFIELTAEFIKTNPAISYMYPGICHGQLLMDDCTEKLGIQHTDVTDNRSRFASIAVLYGWIPAGDRQLIYRKSAPYLVYSVDHGHFFPGGPDWTTVKLKSAAAPALHQEIVGACKFTAAEINAAIAGVAGILSADIAGATAMPIDQWGLSADERAEVASYLESRKEKMVAGKPQP